MQNLSGKVRLGKVYLSNNYKDCYNVKAFFQGPLKLTNAVFSLKWCEKYVPKLKLIFLHSKIVKELCKNTKLSVSGKKLTCLGVAHKWSQAI